MRKSMVSHLLRKRERDGDSCVVCDMDNEVHKQEYSGFSLHVHHIKPRRDYYGEETKEFDYEAANALENLAEYRC